MTINVLMVGPGKVYGGVESHIASLVDMFRGTNVHCCVAMLNGSLSLPGVRTFVLNKRFRGDIHAITQLMRIVREERIDIVHTHYVGPNLYGRIAARLGGHAGLVSTAHFSNSGGIVRAGKEKPDWSDECMFWLDGAMAHLCDRMIIPSDLIRKTLGRVGYPSRKIVTIHHGVDLNRFTCTPVWDASARREFGVRDDAVVVGVIGRLVPVKNVPLFLLAMRRVMDVSNKSVIAMVVGDGPLRPELESEARRLGISKSVIFAGFREDVHHLLSAMDLVVVSSDSELSPYAAWEAMAAGLPVVATSVGALPETIESGVDGLLVTPGDVAGLAEAVSSLVDDRVLRRKMGEKARIKAEQGFSRDVMRDQLIATYEDVIRERACRRGVTGHRST